MHLKSINPLCTLSQSEKSPSPPKISIEPVIFLCSQVFKIKLNKGALSSFTFLNNATRQTSRKHEWFRHLQVDIDAYFDEYLTVDEIIIKAVKERSFNEPDNLRRPPTFGNDMSVPQQHEAMQLVHLTIKHFDQLQNSLRSNVFAFGLGAW